MANRCYLFAAEDIPKPPGDGEPEPMAGTHGVLCALLHGGGAMVGCWLIHPWKGNPMRCRLIARPMFTMMLALATLLLSFGCQQTGDPKGAAEAKPDPVVKTELGAIVNASKAGDLYMAGQPSEADFKLMKEKGFKTVVTLRTEGENKAFDEAKAAKEAGLEYIQLPLGGPDALTDDFYAKTRGLLKDKSKYPLLLHCGSANRVGAVWMAHRVLDEGVDEDTALEEAKKVGLRSPALEAKTRAYIKANKAK